MGAEIYLNVLWLVPVAAWFVTRNMSQIFRSILVAALLGLVAPYALVGLYAFHFFWPISEKFGQFCFYSIFVHNLAGIRVAIFLHLVSANTPIADNQRLLIEVVNVVTWTIIYGCFGLLWGLIVKGLSKNVRD